MDKFKISIKFDLKLLNQLKKDENSGVEIEKTRQHLSIHPIQLNDFKQSIKDVLGNGIAKYHQNLGGILLGFQNIKIPADSGFIHNDSCYIHYDIFADYFVFKPELGKELTGIVNRYSSEHVGLLVYNAFNVSILKPTVKSELEEDWLGNSVAIGSKVVFKITKTDFSSRLPYIAGKLISIIDNPNSTIKKSEGNLNNHLHFDNEVEGKNSEEIINLKINENEMQTEDLYHKTPKQKRKRTSFPLSLNYPTEIKDEINAEENDEPLKKKKKHKHDEMLIENDVTKKRSKKKKKDKNESDDFDNLEVKTEVKSEISEDFDESLGETVSKKSKKRKRKENNVFSI